VVERPQLRTRQHVRGEYRVRDVLVVKGANKKTDDKARVESTGPRADELTWMYDC
jgi:hypothetical protein